MGARIKQVYRRDGITLTVSVEAVGEAATGPFYESFGLVADAIEDFMGQYPELDGSSTEAVPSWWCLICDRGAEGCEHPIADPNVLGPSSDVSGS